MTVTTTTRPASRPAIVTVDANSRKNAPAAPFAFKGRNALVRNAALAGIASLAYVEGKSRADVITQLRITLGKSPTPAELAATALEYVVGRVAQKLGDNSKPIVEQLAFARQLVTQYAAPVKDGVRAKALRKGQLGRRTPEQHKAIRAAEGVWYLIAGELGFGASQTQAEKNKRQAAMKGSTARGKASTVPTPTHGELVKSTATPPNNADEACKMVMQLASSLLAYANKNAAVLPAAYGQSIKRFHGAIAQLEKDRPASDAIAF